MMSTPPPARATQAEPSAIVLFLLSHGIVKIVLVGALLLNMLWASPWMIAFLVAFMGYQIYRIVIHPTFGMTALTIFDAFIVWLTYREWREQLAIKELESPSTS